MRLLSRGAWRLALVAVLAAVRPIAAQEIDCDPGDLEVRKLTFVGNATFTAAELSAGIVTTPSGALYRYSRVFGSPRCLDPVQLPRDAIRLRVYYQNRGFYETKVRMDTVTVDDSALAVTFTIDEGRPLRIDSLRVTGLEEVPDSARIVRGLPIAVGQRFDKDALAAAETYLRASLQNSGYPYAIALPNFSTDTPTYAARVHLNVIPGVRARIGAIRVVVDSGERQDIADPVIRRLVGLRVGELYSAQRLLDASRFLHQTGAYRHVAVGIVRDSSVGAVPDSLVVVRVQLVEGTLRDLRVGLGWGTLDCVRTQATVTNRNFLGGARQLELTARLSKIGIGHPLDGAEDLCKPIEDDLYSDTLNYRVSATLRQPGLFGLGPRNVPSITGYSERRSEYGAYLRSVPLGGVASISRELRPSLNAALSYQLEYGRTEAEPAVYCALFNICGSEERERVRESLRLAVASLTLTRERGSAALSGSSLRFDFRHASDAILSDPKLQFNTLVGDARRFWVFDNAVEIGGRVTAGVVLGSRLSLDELTVSDFIPPQERLYAGGPNSVRGFNFNQLGPITYVVEQFDTVTVGGETFFRAIQGDSVAGENDPVVEDWRPVPNGGNTMFVANLEVRLPSPFLRNLLRYAVFVDAGEVCNFELTEAAAGACTLKNARVTPGVGFRVASPVGPLRVDVAYNMYKLESAVAYHTFGGDTGVAGGPAPLYCVSPGNTRPVNLTDNPPTQSEVGDCPASWRPPQPKGFFNRLTFQFSIGEAF
jgi:outer membrane protein insertion porin family/translocation and assembly module TamA